MLTLLLVILAIIVAIALFIFFATGIFAVVGGLFGVILDVAIVGIPVWLLWLIFHKRHKKDKGAN